MAEQRRADDNVEAAVHHPKHYNMGKYEAINVIEDWELSFNVGNSVKYISRAGHKCRTVGDDSHIKDLLKAWWYLTRELLSILKVPVATLAEMLPTVLRETKPN